MQIQALNASPATTLAAAASVSKPHVKASKAEVQQKVHEVFAETMLSEMMKQIRKSSQKASLFSGGRGEEVFGPQLDQALAEKMSKKMAGQMSSHSLTQLASLGRN